jgi:sugar O-acyltransferase (sialic acid O-acetyltransferase NeuD family)
MLKPLVIWGAAGHAKVLSEFAADVGFRMVALFDNDPAAESPWEGVPLEIGWSGFDRWQAATRWTHYCCVAIGGAHGRDRLEIQHELVGRGLIPARLIHPRAYVAPDARVAQGTQVLAHATVATECRLGEACIINTAATVDHESVIADGVHIAPGATLAGAVEVDEAAFIGAGAVLLPRVRVGADAIVGAGAVVTRDIPEGQVAFGNPARVQRERRR